MYGSIIWFVHFCRNSRWQCTFVMRKFLLLMGRRAKWEWLKKTGGIRWKMRCWGNSFWCLLFRLLLRDAQPSGSARWGSAEGLRAQVGRLESELSFLSALTGINIGSYCRKTEDLTSTDMAEKGKRDVGIYFILHQKLVITVTDSNSTDYFRVWVWQTFVSGVFWTSHYVWYSWRVNVVTFSRYFNSQVIEKKSTIDDIFFIIPHGSESYLI